MFLNLGLSSLCTCKQPLSQRRAACTSNNPSLPLPGEGRQPFSLRGLLLTPLPFHATSGLRAPHPSERTLPVSVSDHSHLSPLSPGFCPLHALPRPPGTSRMPGPWASTGHRCPLPSCIPDLPRPWGRLFLLGPLFSPVLLFPVSLSPSAPLASSPLAPLVGSPHQAHPPPSFTYELLPSICT